MPERSRTRPDAAESPRPFACQRFTASAPAFSAPALSAPALSAPAFSAPIFSAVVRPRLAVLLALCLLLPALASPTRAAEEEDVVRIEVRVDHGEAQSLEIRGQLEGPPRGRPTGRLALAPGAGGALRVEVAILDREHGVVEVHLYPPLEQGDAESGGQGGDGEAGDDGDRTPLAKLLIEPSAGAAAILEDGATVRFRLLSIERQAPPRDGRQ